MSISYTNNDIIDFCLDKEFSNENILRTRHVINDLKLEPLEVLIEIKEQTIEIVKHTMNRENLWRLQSTIHMIKSTLDLFQLDLNCRMIINLDDGAQNSYTTKITTVGKSRNSNNISITDSLTWVSIAINRQKFFEPFSKDSIFSNKKDEVIFRGASTGKPRETLLNQRIEICHRYKDSSFLNLKMTSINNVSEKLLSENGIKKSDILGTRISIAEQLNAKYLLYIYGNSLSTDRMIWHLYANSIAILLEPRDNENDCIWYQHFLEREQILPSVTEESLVDFKGLDKKKIDNIITKQKSLSKNLIDTKLHQNYLNKFLIEYNRIYNK